MMDSLSLPLGGVYHDPAEELEALVDDARCIFLYTIEQRPEAQKCLVNLRDEVLPHYLEHGPVKLIQASQLDRYQQLRGAITLWARRWHLCDGERGLWVIETVLSTLEHWRVPVTAQCLLFSREVRGGWIKYEPPIFKFHRWQILFEPRADYEKQVLSHLKTYLDDAEKQAEKAGLRRASTT